MRLFVCFVCFVCLFVCLFVVWCVFVMVRALFAFGACPLQPGRPRHSKTHHPKQKHKTHTHKTTLKGLADPAPVIASFFLDDQLPDRLRLDGVVTVVDAANVSRHLDARDEARKGLDAVSEAVEQIAYADRIVLNKADLVRCCWVLCCVLSFKTTRNSVRDDPPLKRRPKHPTNKLSSKGVTGRARRPGGASARHQRARDVGARRALRRRRRLRARRRRL